MGRRAKFTDEAIVEAVTSTRTFADAAFKLRCSPDTIQHRVRQLARRGLSVRRAKVLPQPAKDEEVVPEGFVCESCEETRIVSGSPASPELRYLRHRPSGFCLACVAVAKMDHRF